MQVINEISIILALFHGIALATIDKDSPKGPKVTDKVNGIICESSNFTLFSTLLR
jgi:hypothetical protein